MASVDFNQIVFGKKTFSGLLKDIYDNSNDTEQQIVELITEIRPFITGPQQAVMLVPLIVQYMDVKVKNNEHLVKMAAVVQRAMTSSSNGSDKFMLSDSEIEQLMTEANAIEEAQKQIAYNLNKDNGNK